MEIFDKRIRESILIKTELMHSELIRSEIERLSQSCITSLEHGGKILFCGNGGSFADAQHLSAEFTSRFLFDRPSLPSLALGTNSSAMSAIGNDYGYEHIFARELSSIGARQDHLIAITTSGKSANVISALEVALEKGIGVTVLTGASRGNISNSIPCISIPSVDTARIQECHIMLGHIICEVVEEYFFGARDVDR